MLIKAHSGGAEQPRERRRRTLRVALGVILVETIAMWLRGYRVGLGVVVRCRDGHLFTTIWLPGASLKAVRLLWWRFQRCPVGGHWSMVTPVQEAELTPEQRRDAGLHHDIRVP